MDRPRRTRNEWEWTDASGLFPLQQRTIYERDAAPTGKPVLYDARGNPLTWRRRPLGFRPEDAR